MGSANVSNLSFVLQSRIEPGDRVWDFVVPNLPRASTSNASGLIKCISVVSDSSKQQISLRFLKHSENRAIESRNLDRYVSISFEKFRLQYPPTEANAGVKLSPSQPASPKESTDYIYRLLSSGMILNGTHYNFFGHSNSQLKTKSCFLLAATKDQISQHIVSLGDFSKIKTVAKLAKRIGLLFSSAKTATRLDPERCQDVADIKRDDYIFTDGCGLVSKQFANLLVQRLDLRFRNMRYHPAVFQIRYAGYKGVLTVEPKLQGQILVQFRDSMRKVKDVGDHSFAVVDTSKPYSFGYLNDEVILLLHTLGVPESTFLRKQREYLVFLSTAADDPQKAFRFLSYMNEPQLAEKLLLDGLESVKSTIRRHASSEHSRMLNKRAEQRCRILVPQSRLLFGICDPRDVLKPGECAVRATMDQGGVPRTIAGCDVLVTRNPCLHPGDLQKFKAVQCEELLHLTDCIIFPTQGRRPSADLMSGGDLDGDKFFVCWDPDLVPSTVAQAASYQGPPEPVTFKKITHEDRLAYFAGYTNASLGRVKNLYMDWARLKGSMSPQCQELNHLFSRCVDGNRIRVPPHLESLPKAEVPTGPFILDTLHQAAEAHITGQTPWLDFVAELSVEGMELLLSRDNVMLTEFDLFKMTSAWCSKYRLLLRDYLDFFDFSQMSDEQRNWIVGQLPAEERTAKLVLNGLLQSNLLTQSELQSCKLDIPRVRWKCIFDSGSDRLGRFMEVAGKAMEMFHRKLLVLRVDSRLTIAIYIPLKITKYQETVIDGSARLLSFPHSQVAGATYRQTLPTTKGYRLYFSSLGLQLYNQQRRDTWVFLNKPGQEDAPYRAIEDVGDRRRVKHSTIETGINSDLVASVALNKFSSGLQKHVGRVNRNPIAGAELYVISNRDTRSLQILDQWLHHVDTREVLPLFDSNEREYDEPSLKAVTWSTEPEHIRRIARDEQFSAFESLEDIRTFSAVFGWLLEHGQRPALRKAFTYLLKFRDHGQQRASDASIARSMIDFLASAPSLAITFAQVDDWEQLPPEVRQTLHDRSDEILKALATAANQMQALIVEPFKRVVQQVPHMRVESFISLVEHITLVVRSPEVALDVLMGCLEQESARMFSVRPSIVKYLVRNCSGIAMEHIEEALESPLTRADLLQLKRAADAKLVKAHIRIDSNSSVRFATNDHVQLTAASLPKGSLTTTPYSMDALVDASEPGSVTFRCFHPLPLYVEDCSWKAKNCGSFVTSKTMFDALTELLTNPEESCFIHDQILCISDSVQLYEDSLSDRMLFQRRADLNGSQNDAVSCALTSDLTCIWGPPGTGKTHTIAVLLEVLVADPERRILVTAPTHNAVDNVMRKYLHNMKSSTVPTPTALRVSTDIRKVAEDLRQHTCDAMLGKDLNENHAGRRKAQKQIKQCRLIFTTCIGAGLGLLRSERFDTVIIDEASQQVEPQSLVPLAKGCEKAILVGDHVQLRATTHPSSQLLGFDISLFERLYSASNIQGGVQKVMLDTQYRMHRSICAFSSAKFYDGRLHTAVADSTRPLLPASFPWPATASAPPGNKAERMFFVRCAATEDLGRKSKANPGQAALIRTICHKLLQPAQHQDDNNNTTTTPAPSLPSSIAILVPYARQADALRDVSSETVAVSSIDGFQGREADVVVFGTTRCNVHREIGFLGDVRRLNVVVTRARCALLVVGDWATLWGGGGGEGMEERGEWRRLLDMLTPIAVEE
ncbi:MAG: hypothetical protein LQ344_006137 [Seirophora lacunosa]|nr:MAG: hypothetical protein LQ344_006137 [Seirophora lacunosa]